MSIIGTLEGATVRLAPYGALYGVFIGEEGDLPVGFGRTSRDAVLYTLIMLHRRVRDVEGVVRGEHRAKALLSRWRSLIAILEERILEEVA